MFELPTIRIEPPKDLKAFGQLVQDSHTYDWIVFTSPNGVDRFFEMFYKLYSDARSIGGAKIAAIGPGTAERIKAHHLAVDLMPEKFVAEGLIAAFKDQSVENTTILWVKAEQAREVIANELTAQGAIVDEAIAYRTVPEDDNNDAIQRFREEGADVITFTEQLHRGAFYESEGAFAGNHPDRQHWPGDFKDAEEARPAGRSRSKRSFHSGLGEGYLSPFPETAMKLVVVRRDGVWFFSHKATKAQRLCQAACGAVALIVWTFNDR